MVISRAFQIVPRRLTDVLARCEKLYHTCWETRIIRCKPDFEPRHEINSFQLTEKLDIRFTVEEELLQRCCFGNDGFGTCFQKSYGIE